MGSDTVTISIKRPTHEELWQMKETPGDTYDQIIDGLIDFYQAESGSDSDGGGSE
jgi:hypothetical protein